MKKFVNVLFTCFYLALTLAVLVASFWLPSVLFDYQDRQLSAKIGQSKIKPTTFTYSSSLYDTLRILSDEHTFVDYAPSASNRNEKEVCKIALDAIKQLKKYDIQILEPNDHIIEQHAFFQLAIASTPAYSVTDAKLSHKGNAAYSESQSSVGTNAKIQSTDKDDAKSNIATAAIWLTQSITEYGYIANIYIDDISGKTVGFSIHSSQSFMAANDQEMANLLFDSTAKFAQNYYGQPVKLLPAKTIYGTDSTDGFYGNPEAFQTIQLTDESNGLIEMPLKLEYEHLIFNL